MRVYKVNSNDLSIKLKYGDESRVYAHSLSTGDLIFIDDLDYYVEHDVKSWPSLPYFKNYKVLKRLVFKGCKSYLNKDNELSVKYIWESINDINIVDPKINGYSIGTSIEMGYISESIEWQRHVKLEELGIQIKKKSL